MPPTVKMMEVDNWQAACRGGFGDSLGKAVTIPLAPFQIPQMGRVIGVSGPSAASPVGMATRSGPGLVAMHALQRSLGLVTDQTAQVGLCRTVAPSSRGKF